MSDHGPLFQAYTRALDAAGDSHEFELLFVGALLTGLDRMQDPAVDEAVTNALRLARELAR